MLTFLWSAETTLLKISFRNTFRFSNGLDPDQVGADLVPNFLHSKINDEDLHCLFDKAEFTTNCSTLNESSIFLFFLLLLSADYSFSKLTFSKTSSMNTVRLSNSLDPDQDQ